MNYCISILVILLLFFSVNSHCQKLVSGVVKDAHNSEVIVGAYIAVKGTKRENYTDKEGKFYLMARKGDTIVCRYDRYLNLEVVVADSSELPIYLEAGGSDSDFSFGSYPDPESLSKGVNSENFNQGIVNDPLLLIQGRIPGLSLYNRGGNPNTEAIGKIRGFSALYHNKQPLVIIDGDENMSLSNLDPNDIQSIEVVKDAATTAHYGIRGAHGVFIITTKKSHVTGFNIDYKGQQGASQVVDDIKTLTANEFLANGGYNFGSKNDWPKAITRNGFSHVHNLTVNYGRKGFGVRVSGNLRSIQGILKNSGYNQYNFRANAHGSMLKDKLHVEGHAGQTFRQAEVGFAEAFKYARQSNPTAPLYGKDAPYEYNEDETGGYFELKSLYDYTNPVALIMQNRNVSDRSVLNYGAKASYKVIDNGSDHLNWRASVVQQKIDIADKSFYPSNAIYRQQASITKYGVGETLDTKNRISSLSTGLQYTKKMHTKKLTLSGDFSFQKYNSSIYGKSLAGFKNDDKIKSIDDIPLIDASRKYIIEKYSPEERIVSFIGQARMEFFRRAPAYIDVTVRRDGSTRLGDNKKWALFPAINAGIDLGDYFKSSSIRKFFLKTGYGITGSLPHTYGLSQESYNKYITHDSIPYISRLLHYGNADLQHESKREFNFGIEALFNNSLQISLHAYLGNMDNFVMLSKSEEAKYVNTGALTSRGIEVAIQYNIIQKQRLKWLSTIVLSSNQSKLKTLGDARRIFASVGKQNYSLDGMVLGTFAGFVYKGVTPDGIPNYQDINGDGKINSDTDPNTNPDMVVLGNGIPSMELGWNNRVKMGDWSLDVFFRGAFGHSLINENRRFYESDYPGNQILNNVRTSLYVPGLTTFSPSSLFVEKADFLKLDYVSISKRFTIGKANKTLNLSLTGQNLLTLSNYTGFDPEPALIDSGDGINYGLLLQQAGSPYTPGIDSRVNYMPSRTVVLGVCFGL